MSDYDGFSINRVWKDRDIEKGFSKINALIKMYPIKIIENDNNILILDIEGVKYYYGLVSQKLRKEGTNKWVLIDNTIYKTKYHLNKKKNKK